MSAESDIVNVVVSVSAAGPTRAGFGEPLIAAYHTHYPDLVREYSSLAEMVTDGFTVTEQAYLCASAVFAQSPSPPALKVGRRALPPTQVLHVTCLSTANTDTYSFQVGLSGTSLSTITVASTGVPATDVATINTAVTALALSGLTATHSGAVLTLMMSVGKMLDIIPDRTHCSFADITTDPGIATDLNAILGADPNWYGLLLGSNSPAEILAAAAWCESNKRLGGFNATDSAIMDSVSTTDVAFTMKNSGYGYSYGLLSAGRLLSYSAAAWMGKMFPTDPGSENWAFASLAGVPADSLSTSQLHGTTGKNWNVYSPVAGLNLTRFGTTPGGYGYIDLRRGVDWLTNEAQVQIVGVLANNKKIPFTDKGVDIIVATFLGVFSAGVQRNFLASKPAPTVTAPLVANVSPVDRANRNLPSVTGSAMLAGAINKVTWNVQLTA